MNLDQVDSADMRSPEDTLEGMAEEELQEALKDLEEGDAYFNTSKHYAPRFSSKLEIEYMGVFRAVLLISGILILTYFLAVLF